MILNTSTVYTHCDESLILQLSGSWGVSQPFFFCVAVQDRAVSYQSVMSEEGKQSATPAPASTMDMKSESTASPPTGQGVSSVSPPVSTVTQPAPPATEDEEEESEDESEILEESPCGRWQKRREEVHSKSFDSFV